MFSCDLVGEQQNQEFKLVAFNNVKTESIDLKITDSKHDQKIESVTFRDKLQPGQKEKLTIELIQRSIDLYGFK